tara:strand:+ start:125 stop:883 length:759 start_codon:yes stop_codon:yes gene_type:complete
MTKRLGSIRSKQLKLALDYGANALDGPNPHFVSAKHVEKFLGSALEELLVQYFDKNNKDVCFDALANNSYGHILKQLDYMKNSMNLRPSEESQKRLDEAGQILSMLGDALDRGNSPASAMLTLMLATKVFANIEHYQIPFVTELFKLEAIRSTTTKNRKGKFNKKRTALMLGFAHIANLLGSVPTENKLISYLKKYPNEDNCLETGIQECSSIWFEDSRIWFKWCSDISKEEMTDSISTSTYKTDYKKALNL